MLARYKIQQQLHRGPRSRVSRATHPSTGEQVVLKENAPNVQSRRPSPGRSASSTSHRPSVRITWPTTSAWSPTRIASPSWRRCSGIPSLAELLTRGPLSIEAALAVAVDVSSGLADIHAHDVIHRAIHPGNVLVDTATWRAKVADFAEATLLQEMPEPTRRLDASIISPPSSSGQHRFDLTLVRFLSVFASADQPLVLFLDDLQRVDPATLRALGEILRLPEPTHLLVIGACGRHRQPSRGAGARARVRRRLDLVVTDLVMPGMNGRELFAQLVHERPALPALFISGYFQDVLAAPSEVDAAVELLQKPLSADTLRTKIRQVLSTAAAVVTRASCESAWGSPPSSAERRG